MCAEECSKCGKTDVSGVQLQCTSLLAGWSQRNGFHVPCLNTAPGAFSPGACSDLNRETSSESTKWGFPAEVIEAIG